ncbi:adrenocorticotropic hormone receptor-like [Ylistrum balloti]|uniref:adrenocorticotropic hormone receptor-like n=1 Tax=Ylistrum balloti TaxID=509963 RepID=UPI002905CE7F|nr:adrenocorticotropic hormone receptor-like [Ylistrum balloti]
MSGNLNENPLGEANFEYFVFYVTIFLILTLIIVGGNCVIIVTVLRHRDLQQPCNYMIASLAVSDLLFGIFYPIYNLGHLRDSSITRFLAQRTVCEGLITTVQWLEMNSAYHLVAITINRYIAIVKPLQYHVYLTCRRAAVVICTIWITTLVTSAAIYSTTNRDNKEAKVCRYELIFTEAQSIILTIFSGVIPISVMVVLYTIIARIARKHIRDIAACCGADFLKLGKHHVFRREMRSTLTVSLLVGYFAFVWVPHCTYIVYSVACQCYISPYIRLSTRMLVYTNNAINIFIYAGRIHLFRKLAMKDIKQCCSI